jgi:hypothetical protein
MIIEHLIFGIGIGLFVGLVSHKIIGKDHSWIIVASTFSPDIDIAVDILQWLFYGTVGGSMVKSVAFHGSFHNIGVLLLYAAIAALTLRKIGIPFLESFSLAAVGFGAHLIEDGLTTCIPGYAYLWPFSDSELGLFILPCERDLLGIANTETLLLAMTLVALVAAIRTGLEGSAWVEKTALYRLFNTTMKMK